MLNDARHQPSFRRLNAVALDPRNWDPTAWTVARLVGACLARLFESAAPPRRGVFAASADALTRPRALKERPADQAFPNLLLIGRSVPDSSYGPPSTVLRSLSVVLDSGGPALTVMLLTLIQSPNRRRHALPMLSITNLRARTFWSPPPFRRV